VPFFSTNCCGRPQEHLLVTPGSRLTFEFKAIKLLDYREQWAALETSDNPFATVVMAHLKAQETQTKASERKNWKFQLVRELYEKGYNRSQVLDLFRFIDWIIVLPEGLSNSFWNDLKSYEQEKKMTYITSVEKIGFQRGQQEGRKEGRKEGLKEGEQKIVLKMLEKGMSVQEIATITDLLIAEVENLVQSQKTSGT
jgi:flagellar biosynthesis/type III secretory pathway protein FliH